MRASQRPSSPQARLFERTGQAHVTQPKFKGDGQQLDTIDGEPFYGQPDRVNAMGYASAGGRRLYTAEHLRRRGRPIRQAAPAEAKPAARLEADPVVALVRAELLERSERGVAKYGTSLARVDLDRAAWLRHLLEELLDAALYTRRLMLEEEHRAATVASPVTSSEVK